ncbi:hypothetical protein [uncultured Celeribacter sp.]|uniref:hypothetical protein n=1 Tax=uncultured Celeribacter sp. TaxID=1303376 RepID=UPI002AA80A7C|nr:hypothetical protein [uncultured Celeribacter sp.]
MTEQTSLKQSWTWLLVLLGAVLRWWVSGWWLRDFDHRGGSWYYLLMGLDFWPLHARIFTFLIIFMLMMALHPLTLKRACRPLRLHAFHAERLGVDDL